MDWDADNFVPPPVAANIANKWDGEDEEENVKDNWEDDEEEKKRDERARKQSQQSKKPLSKLALKVEERERRENEKKARQKALELDEEIDTANMTPEQIQAEKLRREKIQREADLELAREILGVSDAEGVDKLNPKTKDDFLSLKDALCKKILLYKNSEHFPTFIEEFFRDLSAGLTVNDLKKIKMNLDNMFNEKVRVEREKGKKGKGKGKAKLKMDDNDMMYDEYSAYTIDDYDDFM